MFREARDHADPIVKEFHTRPSPDSRAVNIEWWTRRIPGTQGLHSRPGGPRSPTLRSSDGADAQAPPSRSIIMSLCQGPVTIQTALDKFDIAICTDIYTTREMLDHTAIFSVSFWTQHFNSEHVKSSLSLLRILTSVVERKSYVMKD